MTALLEFDRVGVRYALRGSARTGGARTIDALQDVSIGIREGGRLGIVGESGSGKSTLARVALGFVPAAAGRVLWRGQEVDYRDRRVPRALRREMQVVFQDPFGSLDPRMTAGEAVAEALHALTDAPVAAAEARDRVAASLAEVGLSPGLADRYPHELSGGQCQRVAIARALAGAPDVVLADEPTAALDWTSGHAVLQLFRDLAHSDRRTVLIVTHDARALPFADRVIRMEDGLVVEDATGRACAPPAGPDGPRREEGRCTGA